MTSIILSAKKGGSKSKNELKRIFSTFVAHKKGAKPRTYLLFVIKSSKSLDENIRDQTFGNGQTVHGMFFFFFLLLLQHRE